MTRLDDMLERYGECVSVTAAARILSRSQSTIRNMVKDRRLRTVCGGTRIDVRSIAEYIEQPEKAERTAKMVRTGRKWAV